MGIRRVAVIFDNKLRPETTGSYCLRALEELVETVHFLPEQVEQIPTEGFDLYLNIDDGLRYRLPRQLRPAVWWAIDTHLDLDWYRKKGPDFDLVYTAQRDGADQLRLAGLSDVTWLPLACDPGVHHPHEVPKQFDLCFVGNLFPGPRADLVALLQREFPSSFVGQGYGEAMTRIYSASRVAFNRSIRNDVNMRVFEALGCGTLLVTNDLTDNGQAELFSEGEHLVVYQDAEELVAKVRWYIDHEQDRNRVAASGRALAHEKHTYRRRMETVLRDAERKCVGRALASPWLPRGAGRDNSYFSHSRPEILALVAPTAQRVLDVGCGAGALGAAIKTRQEAFVCGIEIDPQAAAVAGTRLDRVLVGDVDNLDLPYPPAYFDTLVCGDVLEHLRDPAAFLRKARRWLTPGARLVASIPNVRHWSVIESLLNGNFSYEPAGLLDRDHLRFFTRHDIARQLANANFEILGWQAIPGPGDQQRWAQASNGNFQLGRLALQGLSLEAAQEFLTYQYLVTAAASRRPPERTSEPLPTPSAKLGCVLAVQNRPVEYLLRTLRTYRYQTRCPDDQVLVDYGSLERFAGEYRALCTEFGWRYARLDPSNSWWNSSAAYNHAIQILSDDIDVVFKNDVDVLLGADVLERAERFGQRQLCGFCCASTLQETSYPERFATENDLLQVLCGKVPPIAMDAEGILAFPRAWFEEIGGFDLAFDHWGYEDSDLRLRAERSIGAVRDPEPILVHQWHPRNYPLEPILRNRAYYEEMKQKGFLVRNGGSLPRRSSKEDMARSVVCSS